ncbi:helix-turn-helix domain-containing protein [Chloroflexota bacterium]
MDTKINGLDIKIARLKAGLRQYDLTAHLGIPPSQLSEIESGRRKPSPEIIRQILKILDKCI